MILADTAVWIDFLDHGGSAMESLLNLKQVLVHPFVVGEIAMGNLRHRSRIMSLLALFPGAASARNDEVIAFIERHRLFGRGIGFIDAHLLVSTYPTPDAKLWTYDKRLAAVATELRIVADK